MHKPVSLEDRMKLKHKSKPRTTLFLSGIKW